MRVNQIVQNIKCGGCAATITRSLNKLEGIHNATVDVEEGSVAFDCDSDAQLQLAHRTLTGLGYPPADKRNTVISRAKSYVSCAVGRMNDSSQED